MTTGPVLLALAPCEAHQEIVRKARAVTAGSYLPSKDPAFRSPAEIIDEMNAMLVAAALTVKPKLHYVLAHDVQDGLNAT